MKKLLLTTAIIMSFGGTAAFAHHPAALIVDPDIYLMIDENVSDVHRDMTFEDMGGDTTDIGSSMATEDLDVGNAGTTPGGDLEDVGAEMSGDVEDVGAAAEARVEANAMADTEPSGPAGAQR